MPLRTRLPAVEVMVEAAARLRAPAHELLPLMPTSAPPFETPLPERLSALLPTEMLFSNERTAPDETETDPPPSAVEESMTTPPP